jgi:signal transduction histidine kinase
VNERSAVFESFVSFDTGRRAGLGLAIAKAFIEAHGGEIGVEDPPGGGAHIVFTLPIATSEILEE